MRSSSWFVVPIICLCAGCGDSSSNTPPATNTPAAGSSPLTAPVDYLGAIGKGQQTAVKTVDTASLNQAIQLFQVEEGRYPKDLNELVEKKYIPKAPAPPYGMKIVYEPTTGQVKIVRQ
jgi:hypothetical protein